VQNPASYILAVAIKRKNRGLRRRFFSYLTGRPLTFHVRFHRQSHSAASLPDGGDDGAEVIVAVVRDGLLENGVCGLGPEDVKWS